MRMQGVGSSPFSFFFLSFFFFLLHTCVQAEWFPSLANAVKPAEWNSFLHNIDITTGYQKCRNIHTSDRSVHKFITQYRETPATYVIVGSGEVGHVDVKFKDSFYLFEQEVKISKEHYLIIPPYQPVEWLWLRYTGSITICVYEESQDTISTIPATGCDCASAVRDAKTFSVAAFPRTIRKPEQQFFFTADLTPEPNDVTICTIMTVDRLPRLAQMSDMWKGPISVAVFLHEVSEIAAVMDWYLSNNTLRRHVDIHLVHDDKLVAFPLPDRPFPVNILRNVALRYARTSNVFYIEGDFIPSPDLYNSLDPVRERLAAGEKTVFIVAPFSTDKADFDMKLFPADKKKLREMLDAGSTLRDLSYFNSHSAFDFNNWFRSTEIYGMAFAGGYEPYYIGPKNYPLFEEIFIGCGQDKVSHPAELNAAGYSFKVLNEGFIVHVDSTGMGSAWCRGWSGNERSTMKWEAFTTKTSQIYRGNTKDQSFDSRVPWWDLAPVALTKALPPPPEVKEEVCEGPPKDKDCPLCPDKESCDQYIEQYTSTATDLAIARETIKKLDAELSEKKEKTTTLEKNVKNLRAENDRLQEYSKFVLNLSVGIVVVMTVVLGVGICIWPRGKKVWMLPSWKATHHNL